MIGHRMLCQRSAYLRSRPFVPISTRSAHRSFSVHAQKQQTSALPRLQPLDESYDEWHTFSPYANWLIPGSVMLGRYPFVEPSRCRSREQGEEQLSKILSTGITTFVCLQEEIPAQDDMKLGGKDGFLPYKATAQLIRAAMNGPPVELEALHALRTPALDKFLPPKKQHKPATSDPTPSPPGGSRGAGKDSVDLQFLYSPIVDLGLPSTEALEGLLKDLEKRLVAGEKLYIHCWGGRGRAGTVGSCLLQSAYGLSADEALLRVQRSFDTRGDVDKNKSPETPEQVVFVKGFASNRKP